MAIQTQLQSFAYFENMVSRPTWKDILLDLISTNSIDPWNIDIIALGDAFIKRVRDMKKMDFAMQANVILAAAILLKYKSNYLRMLSIQTEIPEFIQETGMPDGAIEELPELELSSRIPPRRQITLEELISEMEKIIKYDDADRVHVPRGSITETVDLELPDHDIEHDLQQILGKVKQGSDSEGWFLFSTLVDGLDLRETVYSLVCLLHLVQMGEIDIRQDKMFGEVFIKLLGKAPDPDSMADSEKEVTIEADDLEEPEKLES